MTYGLVGAHRVGKTTLMERLSNETDYGLIETDVGSVFTKAGINPATHMDFATRIRIQNLILDHCESIWSRERGYKFFTDRTPICMLGYTTADLIGCTKLTDEEFKAYMDYRQRCFDSTNRFFGLLVVVQPGIAIVDPGDKPTAALNRAYIEHLNSLMIGLAHSEETETTTLTLDRDCLDLDERCSSIIASIEMEAGFAKDEFKGEHLH